MPKRVAQQRFNFTQAMVRALECPPLPKPDKSGSTHSRMYVYDGKQPGLCLAVTSTGSKAFYVLKKINGRVERIRLAAFPDISVDDARDLAKSTIGKIAEGKNPAEERRIARGEQMFGDVFRRYIEDHAKPHKRTWKDDQAQFDRYVKHLDRRRLSTI